MTTKHIRTDIHCPKNLIPSNYEFVSYAVNNPKYSNLEGPQYWKRILREHMANTGGHFATHTHGGTCQVCGAHAIYMGVFYHKPTNEYIQTGWECAGNISKQAAEGIKKFQFRCREELKYETGKENAKKVLESKGLSKAWDIFINQSNSSVYEIRKIVHYVDILIRYGDLYDRQWEYLQQLLIRLEKKETNAKLKPIPCGRITIIGKVLTTKKNLTWGGLNMLVEMFEGWKVFGKVPTNLLRDEDFQIGATVKFDATVKKSDKDETFGFFSRPTAAEILVPVTEKNDEELY